MIRKAIRAMPTDWRTALRNPYARVGSNGGFYALDVQVFVQRRGSHRHECYRIVWSDRLTATVDGSGHLVPQHWGTVRTGPLSEAIIGTADVLKALRKLRGKRAVARTAA